MKHTALVLSVLMISPGMVHAKDEKMVVVSGDCLKNLVPDRGAVTMTTEVLEKSPGLAIEKATEQYNRVRDRVKKMNLKNVELETTEFGVNEEFDWNNNQKRSRGFRSRMGLRVTTSETAKLGDLAQLAAELKVQDVSGLQHFVSRESQKSARESCLEEAFQNAKVKAERLAKISGQKLGSALQIQESNMGASPIQPPMMRAFAMKSMDAQTEMAGAPVIEAGVTKMNVSIQVGFELL